jgi:hypothetical protein
MWKDTIVEDIHAVREQLLERFDGDLHRYCEYVRSLAAPASASAQPALQPALPADAKAGLKSRAAV